MAAHKHIIPTCAPGFGQNQARNFAQAPFCGGGGVNPTRAPLQGSDGSRGRACSKNPGVPCLRAEAARRKSRRLFKVVTESDKGKPAGDSFTLGAGHSVVSVSGGVMIPLGSELLMRRAFYAHWRGGCSGSGVHQPWPYANENHGAACGPDCWVDMCASLLTPSEFCLGC
jgi:hypothetical protein